MREQSGSKTEVCLAMSVRIRAKETAPCSRTQYGTVGTPVYIPCTTLVQRCIYVIIYLHTTAVYLRYVRALDGDAL